MRNLQLRILMCREERGKMEGGKGECEKKMREESRKKACNDDAMQLEMTSEHV